jgi:hypothetical protein
VLAKELFITIIGFKNNIIKPKCLTKYKISIDVKKCASKDIAKINHSSFYKDKKWPLGLPRNASNESLA